MPNIRPLSYQEKNLINVLARTSAFPYYELESLYIQCYSIDKVMAIMKLAEEGGMSLKDTLIPMPIFTNEQEQ